MGKAHKVFMGCYTTLHLHRLSLEPRQTCVLALGKDIEEHGALNPQNPRALKPQMPKTTKTSKPQTPERYQQRRPAADAGP